MFPQEHFACFQEGRALGVAKGITALFRCHDPVPSRSPLILFRSPSPKPRRHVFLQEHIACLEKVRAAFRFL